MAGVAVSHYRILEKLGGGGMGVVYKAQDTTLGRQVALKFLSEKFSQDPEKLERFRREAWAASVLNHPNICTVYEVGEQEGRFFIAMELAEGETLAEKLKAGRLPIEEAVQISRQIAEALEEAHEHNIVHRDLKPANVMVNAKGRIKVLDFGLAKQVRPFLPDASTDESTLQTRAGVIMGTVPYMAPEQLQGRPVDMRADLYALGGVLYEMVTGQRPFPETPSAQLVASILTRQPQPPHELNPKVTTELERVVLKALAKEPALRYQSAQELLADLGPQITTPQSPRPVAGETALLPKTPRLSVTTAVIAALSLALLAFLILSVAPAIRRHSMTSPSVSQGISGKKELAVLPFSVIGGGPSDNAFSRGLAETLAAKLTQLSSGQSLRVVPVGELSAQHVETPSEARKAFGVNLALVGSLERAGDRVRISYALVNPLTDRQVDAETLTLAASNPFSIEDRVVVGTAGMLGLTIENAQRQEVESHGTLMADAFLDYLKGLGYMQNYDRSENIDKAIDSFRSALNVDSTYTLAYAALGEAYWHRYDTTEDSRWVDHAQESCGHAVTLNANLPATHLCLGIVESGTGQYAEAIQEFQKVLKVQPTNISAYGGLGYAQSHSKRVQDAEATYRRAISVRPHYWAPYNWLGALYFSSGHNEKAAEMFRQVTRLAPQNHLGYYNLGAVNYMLGNWVEAEKDFKQSLAIHHSPEAYSNLGTVTFYEGHFRQSAAYFEKAVRLRPEVPELWGNLADAYKWSPGEKVKAVPTYRRAAKLAQEGLRVNPSSYDLLGKLALYEAQTSNARQAMRHLRRALSLAPRNVQLMYNAAVVYHLSGQRTKALDYLQKALRYGYSIQSIRSDPEWKGMKDDLLFQKLIMGEKH